MKAIKDFNTDKTGKSIYLAGLELKDFDYKNGFKKLLEIDKTGKWVYKAKYNWKEFNYKRAFGKLPVTDTTGE